MTSAVKYLFSLFEYYECFSISMAMKWYNRAG